MRGPAPKPDGERQRRNKPGSAHGTVMATTVVVAGMSALSWPDPPGSWSPEACDDWRELSVSPLSQTMTASDFPALMRLFRLREQLTRALDQLEHEELVSEVVTQKGFALVPNPIVGVIGRIEAMVRPLEDRFGLSPMARLRIGIKVGEAKRSLDDAFAVTAPSAPAGAVTSGRRGPSPKVAGARAR